MSNSVSAIRLLAMVGYGDSGTLRCTRNSFMTSPPRAGTTAFTPAPARYAPVTVRHRSRRPGSAAIRMLRQAVARSTRFDTWNPIAIRSAPNPTSDS